ncbi:MAG: hypothetical protein QOI73_2434 [Solirubrobacteraceae bacterium]|nr:hypothetical protein [Solirubrobacteraceae bacterium]
MLNGNRKRGLIGAIVTILVIAAGAAAYWSAGGSGTGTAPTAAGTTPITVNQTTVLTGMYPGDSAQTISGNFTNTNSGPIHVSTVTASISSVTGGAGACTAADYTLASAVMTVPQEVAVASNTGSWTGATIKFNNTTSNQDGCKGAVVNLAYAVA